jgi:hypothetical protein
MKTETRIQKAALALLTAGFLLCGCGRPNPLGVVAEQRGDPPWVKRDDQGRIRAIGRPALSPREDSTQVEEVMSREDPPWVKRDTQGRIRSIGRPAPGPRGDEGALLIDRPKRQDEETP